MDCSEILVSSLCYDCTRSVLQYASPWPLDNTYMLADVANAADRRYLACHLCLLQFFLVNSVGCHWTLEISWVW
jgi:hypothetical protein